jgi:hypothetical protein
MKHEEMYRSDLAEVRRPAEIDESGALSGLPVMPEMVV